MYFVGYEDDKIVEFSFYPRWCGTDGGINEKLGIALFSTFPILPDWTLAADGRLVRKIREPEYICSCYPQSIKQLTDEAQQAITKMMDEAKSMLPILKAKFGSR